MMATIRERILARPELNDMRQARDITGLSVALNAQPPMVSGSRFITARTVLAECANGDTILSALEAVAVSNASVKWAVNFLGKDSGLDIGNPVTLDMVEQLVSAGVLTESQGAAIKGMALQPHYVTQEQVAMEMYNPDGTEK